MEKKPDKLFELLLKIAENMQDCGKMFNEFVIETDTDLSVFSEKIKDLESRGDAVVHETIVELNHSFITPIDQEDILMLAEQMDEVVDGMEECAIYFDIYGMKKQDERIKDFRKYIQLCTEELREAIRLLSQRKLKLIREHTVKVKSYEEMCDTIERNAIRNLFEEIKDPIVILKHKDIFGLLEDTVDACQNVAKALDSIVMKNA